MRWLRAIITHGVDGFLYDTPEYLIEMTGQLLPESAAGERIAAKPNSGPANREAGLAESLSSNKAVEIVYSSTIM
jgi:hypothetical protein